MNRTWRRTIGFLEIGGGVVGLLLGFLVLSTTLFRQPIQPLTLLLLPVIAAAFGLSIAAGVLLLRDRPAGLRLSILTQALQVPLVSMGAFAYSFFTGVQLALTFGVPTVGFRFNLGGQVEILFGDTGEPFFVGVNVVALFFLWKLLQARREI